MNKFFAALLALLLIPTLAFGGSTDRTVSITANGDLHCINTNGLGSGAFGITGTWTGTLVPKFSVAGTITDRATLTVSTSAGASVTSFTANGAWFYSAAAKSVCIEATASMTGTAVVTLYASDGGGAAGAAAAGGGLTDAQLRATPVPVSGTVTATGPLTDAQLRATAVPVSGTVTTTPPSNASTNVAQINGVTPLMGNGVAGAGAQRVAIVSDNTPFKVILDSATSPTSFADGAVFTPDTTLVSPIALFYQTTATNNPMTSGDMGVQQMTVNRAAHMNLRNASGVELGITATPVMTNHSDGTNTRTLDPCVSAVKVYTPITLTANGQLITGTASKKTYICSVVLVSAAAENISFVAGTGSVCATSTVAVIGGTTAATGPNLAANGGFAFGDGAHALAATTVNADNLCLFKSGAGVVAGVMTSVVR